MDAPTYSLNQKLNIMKKKKKIMATFIPFYMFPFWYLFVLFPAGFFSRLNIGTVHCQTEMTD